MHIAVWLTVAFADPDPSLACRDGTVEIPADRHGPSFCIERTEVTVAAWRACVDARACPPPAIGMPHEPLCTWSARPGPRDDHPVNCVTWEEAATYCAWIGGALPSVEQWTRAARSGRRQPYPWGSATPGSGDACWARSDGPCPVGAHRTDTSPAGAVDLAGNVVEYTTDNPENGWRAQRGGCWYHTKPELLRVDLRQVGGERIRVVNLGLRCVVPPGPRVRPVDEPRVTSRSEAPTCHPLADAIRFEVASGQVAGWVEVEERSSCGGEGGGMRLPPALPGPEVVGGDRLRALVASAGGPVPYEVVEVPRGWRVAPIGGPWVMDTPVDADKTRCGGTLAGFRSCLQASLERGSGVRFGAPIDGSMPRDPPVESAFQGTPFVDAWSMLDLRHDPRAGGLALALESGLEPSGALIPLVCEVCPPGGR